MKFNDRFDAGEQLAGRLQKYAKTYAIILAIPRGGVETGYAIATSLHLPLNVVLTKKIGYPGQEEYAIGAVSLTGIVLNPDIKLPQSYIDSETARIRKLLEERYVFFTGKRAPVSLKGKIAIIVDDGIATGNTMFAAIDAVKSQNPEKIVVAVPVGPPSAIEQLKAIADEVVCLHAMPDFFAVGQFYLEFEQVDDARAVSLVEKANEYYNKKQR